MVIKAIDDKSKVLKTLQDLSKIANNETLNQIKKDLSNFKKGYYNEQQTAYIIDYEFGDSDKNNIIHDLRIEHNKKSAQIDHILISQGAIYIFESKYFGQKVEIDKHGNWYTYQNNKKIGIKSPIEQNKRHIKLLKEVLSDYNLIPTRMGIRIDIKIFNFILISPNSIIEGDIPQNVLKYDLVHKKIDETIDKECNKFFGFNTLKLMLNLISKKEAHHIATSLVKIHRPIKFNYAKRYGVNLENTYDKKLFEQLRIKRNKIAKEQNIKPYIIFNNSTLENLATLKPQTPEQMLEIKGIGKIKFTQYGYKLLNHIIEYEKEKMN